MTAKQALKIRDFAIKWIDKVVGKQTAYKKRLRSAVDALIPADIGTKYCKVIYDPYGFLAINSWDSGVYGGMGDFLTELLEWDNHFGFTKKANNDLSCTLRVAVDLLIEQSGGVVGYTVGDLRKAFDGDIPDDISRLYACDFSTLPDAEPVWL